MELKPINEGSPLPKTVDNFGQPENTKEDSTHLGATPGSSAQAHYRADTDSSPQGLHHTLGTNRNQAASGNHVHDGIGSKKLGLYQFNSVAGHEGEIISTLSITGSRGGNAAVASIISLLANFIDFTDNTTP